MILINNNWENVGGIEDVCRILGESISYEFADDVKRMYRGERVVSKVEINNTYELVCNVRDLIDFISQYINDEFASRVSQIFEPPKQVKTNNNNVRNTAKAITDYQSYMRVLKQHYLEYKEEIFLPSKIQNFIDEYQLDSKLGIHSDDVMKDLWEIRKTATEENNSTCIPPEQPKNEQTPTETTTPPVQAQRTQTQNTNAIQPEEDEHDYLEKRGVDKDFGIRNDEHGDFYFFVINMSNTELINTINNQYKAIKGTWTLAPCMGEYGCIEFAATLLLWKYAVINFNKNQKAYASLQIMLGDLICCAFFGMPAGEWSDKADPIINAHTDILSYEEFGNVYNYLRNNHADRIHSLEFNEGNAEKEAYRHLYTKFTETYNASEGFKETLNFYTANGLKIKEDMHFNVANENKDILKSLLVQEWKSVWGELKEDAQIQQLSPTITDKFYVSSYRCPICGRHMYKTVFPIGSEFPIRTENGYISMKRIFTCKPCLTFFTPLPKNKLSCGQYYSLRLDTPAKYDLLLETYDNHGTIYGRPDA